MHNTDKHDDTTMKLESTTVMTMFEVMKELHKNFMQGATQGCNNLLFMGDAC